MKKIISLVLALLMLCTIVTPAFAASYNSYSDLPVIYCQGQGAIIRNASGENIYPINTSDSYIGDAVKDCLPYLLDAIKNDTDESWAAYRDKLISYVEPVYRDLRLDNNGDASDGSYAAWSYSESSINYTYAVSGGKYSMRNFTFQMDWRLDPFQVAETLHTYISDVKRITGASKVNAVFRCEACSVMGAYFSMYGYDDFNCVEMYVSSLYGIDAISAAFSGNFSFDAASVMRFLDDYEENLKAGIENDELTDLLYSTLHLLKETYTLDGALALLTPYVKKIYQNAIAPALLQSYGNFPGIWTLVRADEYDEAKKWVFNGVEEEYAGLIEKLDYYHNEVGLKADELILNAKKAGVKVAVYAKYGEYQTYPLASTSSLISDYGVTLANTSYGATTTSYTTVLSDYYINSAKEKGTDKYISPDKKVDASTCLLPDTTWFIFNSEHKDFPETIDAFMMNFFATDGALTVFDDESCPQYMYCSGNDSGNVLSPLTAENGFQTEETPSTVNDIKVSVKERVIAFVNSLIAIIRDTLVKLFNGELDLSFLNELN